MKRDAEAGGLEFVAPLAIKLTLEGRDVVVTPIVMRELPQLIKLIGPILATLPKFGSDTLDRLQAGTPTSVDLVELGNALLVSGDAVMDALVLCSRQSEEWVGGLLPDRAAELAAACIQVNADFFRRAMPNLQAMASRLQTAWTTPMRSNSS